jgi:hypothetical protein
MFLFTSKPNAPEPSQQPTEGGIARHLRQAAEATGISFDYLMRTAKRESGLNPAAKAQSSSATGLFQFIEQTWLGLVKKEGANHGLAAEAEAIQQDRSGRYVVPDDAQRKQILNLRKDPALASTFAGVFTQKNRDVLKGQLNREPNPAELYMAHFLGVNGASELIGLAQASPTQSAASAFPDAAAANRSIFFDGKGRARTVREVYARLSSFHTGEDTASAATAVAAVQPAQAAPAPPQMVVQPGGSGSIPRLVTQTQARSNNALHGLFRGGGETQGADKLRKTWLNVAESRLRPDSPSFFPREGAVQQVAAIAPDPVNATASDATEPVPTMVPADLPLPPVRTGSAGATATANGGRPIDLTQFGSKKQ